MLEHDTKIVTPTAIALFPHLVEPDLYEGSLDYKVSLILDPSVEAAATLIANIEEIVAAQLAVSIKELQAGSGKDKALAKQIEGHSPLLPEFDEEGDETGRMILKVKSKAAGVTGKGKKWERKINIFDSGNGPTGKPALIPHGTVDIWGGSLLKVELKVNRYFAKGLKKAGVSFYIEAVQVIELKTGGGSGGDGFGIEEGGYEAPSDTFGDPGGTEGGDPYNQEGGDF